MRGTQLSDGPSQAVRMWCNGRASGVNLIGLSDEMGTGVWEEVSVKMTPRSASVKTEHRESAFILRPMTRAGHRGSWTEGSKAQRGWRVP